MKLEIDKKFIDDAVQDAVADIKQNFVPISVIEDIKAEIDDLDVSDLGKMGIITAIFEIIDKHTIGTCDDCDNPCIMYEKGMRGCKKSIQAERRTDDKKT